MIRKKMQWRIKAVALCLTILFFCGVGEITVKAASEQVSINLYATNNGIPVSKVVYSAANLDVAYQKIINGDISSAITSGAQWKNFQNQIQPDITKVKPNEIEFPNKLVLAPGKKQTAEDAQAIIEQMLQIGGSGFPLLTELNGEITQNILFHQPERGMMSNTFTNRFGKAVAIVDKGLTAIMTRDGKFQKLIMVDKDQQDIDLDVANTDNRLSLSLEDVPSGEKTNFNRYIVESGEKNSLTFKMTIKKSLMPLGGSILLASSPNLIIKSITPDTEVQGLEITEETTPSQLATGNPNRNITFPTSSEDIILTIIAYVAPTSAFQASTGNMSISATGTDANGVVVSAKTPQILLSGANFAMMDNTKNKFATGAEYVLGKYIDGKNLIYSAQQGWIHVADMKNLDLSQVTVLKGGQQYSIGNSEEIPIPDATTRFNYNAEENQRLNQSLIQIIGLAPGDNYFIYPVKAADGQSATEKPLDFSVYSYSSIGRNTSLINHNTLGEAKVQNVVLNTTIPDFKSGTVEYNVLSINNRTYPSMSALIRIILPIALISLLMLIIGFCLIKFV